MEENKNVKKKTLIIMVIGVIIGLVICFVIAYNNVKLSENQNNNDNSNNSKALTSSKSDSKNMNITSGGSYDLSGEYESVTINTKEEVTLNLNGVEITNSNGPGINVVEAELVIITLSEENKISSTTTEDLDGAIYSKADLVFSGTGSLEVKSNYDGIVSKDSLVIKNGTYTINSDDDGIRGKDSVEISDGTFTINAGGNGIKSTNDEDEKLGYVTISSGNYNITAKNDGIKAITKVFISGGNFDIIAVEGIEATYVKIDDGTINIEASDDGINAGQKSNSGTPTVEINGGNITITMGQGDTDGVDSNGDIIINGGTISVTGQSTFDYDGTGTINGGTVICNDEEVTTLPNQFMGGGMKDGNFKPMNQDGEQEGERPQIPFNNENMNDENRTQMPPK